MNKLFTAFSMSWGNFCSLPCPIKKWDSNYKSLMLGWLPTVGAAIGLLWILITYGLAYFQFPFLFISFIVTFIPYALSGFMHMDGFMDCNDAIMSRRPLEDRQRILKDTHTGAFAVISVVFLVLCAYSCIATGISNLVTGNQFAVLGLIVVLSRTVAGLEVLISKPLQTSQYARMKDLNDHDKDNQMENAKAEENVKAEEIPQEIGKTSTRSGVILLLVQAVIYTALCFIFSPYLLVSTMVSLATIFGTLISITIAKRNLKGMSGDIAGFGICWGELIGMVSLIFL